MTKSKSKSKKETELVEKVADEQVKAPENEVQPTDTKEESVEAPPEPSKEDKVTESTDKVSKSCKHDGGTITVSRGKKCRICGAPL